MLYNAHNVGPDQTIDASLDSGKPTASLDSEDIFSLIDLSDTVITKGGREINPILPVPSGIGGIRPACQHDFPARVIQADPFNFQDSNNELKKIAGSFFCCKFSMF